MRRKAYVLLEYHFSSLERMEMHFSLLLLRVAGSSNRARFPRTRANASVPTTIYRTVKK